MKDLVWRLIRSTHTEPVFLILASLATYFRKFIPRHNFYSSEHKYIVRNNIKYDIDRSDYTQWKIYSYNRDKGAQLASHLLRRKTSAVVLDIGSNIGEFSFNLISTFLKTPERDLTIYAFEPNPVTFSKLEKNLSLNSFPDRINLKVFNIGLGKKRDTLKLDVNNHHSGASSLLNNGNVQVEIWSLNEFLREHPTDSVDFIKIDVECFEPFVLQGSNEIIKKFKPFIYVEHNINCNGQHKMGENFVFDFLIDQGYQIEVDVEHKLVPIQEFSILKAMGKVDLLAIPSNTVRT